MTTLILKKTASIYGIGGGNDYTVLDGPRVIGRNIPVARRTT